MDTNTRQIALNKLKVISKYQNSARRMILKHRPIEEVVDKLNEELDSIRDLKSLLKAFSITEKVNQGKHDEAAEEARRLY